MHNISEGTKKGKPAPYRWPRRQGQLLYYVQAVDRFRRSQNRAIHDAALRFPNLSTTKGIMGMLPLFLGMRVRLTRKICAPELVQEATGEVWVGWGARACSPRCKILLLNVGWDVPHCMLICHCCCAPWRPQFPITACYLPQPSIFSNCTQVHRS